MSNIDTSRLNFIRRSTLDTCITSNAWLRYCNEVNVIEEMTKINIRALRFIVGVLLIILALSMFWKTHSKKVTNYFYRSILRMGHTEPRDTLWWQRYPFLERKIWRYIDHLESSLGSDY